MANRAALVTGGMGGIGTAICRRLADAGNRVVALDLVADPDQVRRWLDAEKDGGYEFSVVTGDVTDFGSCAAAVAEAEAGAGPIEILVNAAGITRDGTLKKMEVDQWRAVLSTNLDSVFNVTKQVVGGMIECGFGRIISISSLNGEKGQYGQTNYSAAKAGMHGFTMALAQETAAKGVTVNTVSPGYVATSMVMAIAEEIREQIVAQIPVGRLGEPAEIAAVVAFLASDETGFITGSNISINGGQHMH